MYGWLLLFAVGCGRSFEKDGGLGDARNAPVTLTDKKSLGCPANDTSPTAVTGI